MAHEENSASNGSPPGESNCTAVSELEGTFTVAQLGPVELRRAIVSPNGDISFFDRLPSGPDEAQPMRQNCSLDATLPRARHADEEFYMWDQLYTEPPLQPLPPQPLPTIPSTAPGKRVTFSPNNVNPRYPWESVPTPSPLFGPPSPSAEAARSSYMPISTAPASVPKAHNASRSVHGKNGQASRMLASSVLEKVPVNTEDPHHGLNIGETAQAMQDQGPANRRLISCKCGNPFSWQSNMIECMGPRHRGGRWFHLVCARLTIDTIPEHDWFCTECSVGDSDIDSGDKDFSALGSRLKRPHRTDSTIRVAKKPRGSQAPATGFTTLASNTPNTPKSMRPLPSGRQARKTASSPKSPATGGGIGAGWTTYEQAMAAQVMTAMVQEKHKSLGKEERWEEAARRLQMLDVNRTAAGIKNHWNRAGRAASGVDERKTPNPRKMKTGLQAASKATALREKRKVARAAKKEKKRKAAEERQEEEKAGRGPVVIEDEDEDDDDADDNQDLDDDRDDDTDRDRDLERD